MALLAMLGAILISLSRLSLAIKPNIIIPVTILDSTSNETIEMHFELRLSDDWNTQALSFCQAHQLLPPSCSSLEKLALKFVEMYPVDDLEGNASESASLVIEDKVKYISYIY